MATDYPKCLYENRLDDGTPAASTTAAGYSVLNLRDWRAYTWWKPTALPATVTVDCGSAKAADYWAVYGHDLATQGCTIELRGSTDNFSASNVLVDTVTPSTDAAFVRHFASATYRYWRLRITGAASMPSLAIASVGVAMDIPAYLSEGFDPLGLYAPGRAQPQRARPRARPHGGVGGVGADAELQHAHLVVGAHDVGGGMGGAPA